MEKIEFLQGDFKVDKNSNGLFNIGIHSNSESTSVSLDNLSKEQLIQISHKISEVLKREIALDILNFKMRDISISASVLPSQSYYQQVIFDCRVDECYINGSTNYFLFINCRPMILVDKEEKKLISNIYIDLGKFLGPILKKMSSLELIEFIKHSLIVETGWQIEFIS